MVHWWVVQIARVVERRNMFLEIQSLSVIHVIFMFWSWGAALEQTLELSRESSREVLIGWLSGSCLPNYILSRWTRHWRRRPSSKRIICGVSIWARQIRRRQDARLVVVIDSLYEVVFLLEMFQNVKIYRLCLLMFVAKFVGQWKLKRWLTQRKVP